MQGDETLPTVALHSMETGADGPPLVFLHGVLRNGSCCTPLLPEFSVRHRVHALDLRGHGRSPGGDSYRVMDYLGDVVSYLRHHVPRPAILYGHSLGAMLATGAAAYAPECVRGIVLEDPPFHTMGKRMRGTPLQDYFEGIRPFAGSSEPTGDLARQLSEVRVLSADKATRVPLGTLRDATALRFLASCLRHVQPEVMTPIIAGEWLDGYAMEEIFAGVRCPALLLQCDAANGGMLTEEDAQRFASLASDCTRSYLKGVGHQAHWTQPGEVSRRTLEFLLSLEDRA